LAGVGVRTRRRQGEGGKRKESPSPLSPWHQPTSAGTFLPHSASPRGPFAPGSVGQRRSRPCGTDLVTLKSSEVWEQRRRPLLTPWDPPLNPAAAVGLGHRGVSAGLLRALGVGKEQMETPPGHKHCPPGRGFASVRGDEPPKRAPQPRLPPWPSSSPPQAPFVPNSSNKKHKPKKTQRVRKVTGSVLPAGGGAATGKGAAGELLATRRRIPAPAHQLLRLLACGRVRSAGREVSDRASAFNGEGFGAWGLGGSQRSGHILGRCCLGFFPRSTAGTADISDTAEHPRLRDVGGSPSSSGGWGRPPRPVPALRPQFHSYLQIWSSARSSPSGLGLSVPSCPPGSLRRCGLEHPSTAMGGSQSPGMHWGRAINLLLISR